MSLAIWHCLFTLPWNSSVCVGGHGASALRLEVKDLRHLPLLLSTLFPWNKQGLSLNLRLTFWLRWLTYECSGSKFYWSRGFEVRSLCILGCTYAEYIPSPAFVCLLIFVFEMGLLCSSDCLGTQNTDQGGLKLSSFCLYSDVLGHRCGVPPAGSFCFLERGSL